MAYQPISLTNYASQLAEVERQKRMAQALQEQANAPIEIQSYKGVQAPIPWSSVLARGLAAVGANIKEGRAAQRAAELEQFKAAQTQQQLKDLLAPVPVAEQPGFRPMPDRSQLAAALASANAPTSVAGMAPTAGAGGMPVASNASLAAALGGQRPNAGASNPLVAGAAPSLAPPPAPVMPQANIAPVQAAPAMPATTRPATSQELQERAVSAIGSPFEAVRALGVNALERSQAMEDEQRKRAQTREDEAYKLQTTADFVRQSDIRNTADLMSAIEGSDLSEEQKKRYRGLAPLVGKEGLLKVIEEDSKPQKGALAEYAEGLASGLVPSTTSFAQFMDMKKGALRNVAAGSALVDTTGGTPAFGAFGAKIESTVSGLIPGVTVTSRERSPEKNAAVGGVSGSFHVSDNARDFVPPAGMTTAQMASQLKAKMPGFDVIDEKDHVHIEPGPSMISAGLKEVYRAPFRPVSASSANAWGLTPEESAAINTAAAENRVDASRLNSRTAKIQAGILLSNPGINLINNRAIAAMTANPTFQTKAIIAASLPEVLENVKEAGQKLKFSDVQYIGKLQAWKKGQLNDPDFIQYMNQRNDALMTIANVMRATGATDKSIEMEVKAAPETMSPKAFEGWYEGQMKSLKPRLDRMAPFAVKPAASGGSKTGNPLVDKYLP